MRITGNLEADTLPMFNLTGDKLTPGRDSSTAMPAVTAARARMATAVNNASRQIGQVFGVPALGRLLGQRGPVHIAALARPTFTQIEPYVPGIAR